MTVQLFFCLKIVAVCIPHQNPICTFLTERNADLSPDTSLLKTTLAFSKVLGCCSLDRKVLWAEAEHGERRLPAISPLFLSANYVPPRYLHPKTSTGWVRIAEAGPQGNSMFPELGSTVLSPSCARNGWLTEKHAYHSSGPGYHIPDRGAPR